MRNLRPLEWAAVVLLLPLGAPLMALSRHHRPNWRPALLWTGAVAVGLLALGFLLALFAPQAGEPPQVTASTVERSLGPEVQQVLDGSADAFEREFRVREVTCGDAGPQLECRVRHTHPNGQERVARYRIEPTGNGFYRYDFTGFDGSP